MPEPVSLKIMPKSAFSSFRKRFVVFAVLLLLAGALGGCASMFSGDWSQGIKPVRPEIGVDKNISEASQMYGELHDGGFDIPAIPYEKVPKEFRRQLVPNITGERPGVIVVDTKAHFLYYTLQDGDAIRYGVGVGKAGFEWSGRAHVQYKKEWPRWTPPREMIGRQPQLVKYKNGMEPGIMNPLGARAFYIFRKNAKGQEVDTGYRIHGSPEWWSIGQSMSSGCIRLMNQDIIDLYGRVPVGTPILVK